MKKSGQIILDTESEDVMAVHARPHVELYNCVLFGTVGWLATLSNKKNY